MTSNQEDTMYIIHTEVEELNISKEFHTQVEKMCTQDKHKWKDMCEKWEYAFNKVKNKAKEKPWPSPRFFLQLISYLKSVISFHLLVAGKNFN